MLLKLSLCDIGVQLIFVMCIDFNDIYPQSKISNNLFYNLLQNLHLESVVEDITGKEIKAIRLVSLLIQYFKKLLLEAMDRSIAEGKVSETDIDFVLAVPANCADGARLFMCEAAKKVSCLYDSKSVREI